MTNQDDTFAELAAARAYITRGKTDDALEAIDQAIKLVTAEFAALIADVAEAEKLLIRQTVEAVNERAVEMPVSWGYRYEAGMMDDGDWRSHP